MNQFDVIDAKYPLRGIICPKCGQELRMGMGEHTHSCVNGHSYNIQRYFELKSQIKSTLRNKYPKEADLISVDQLIG